MLAPTKKCVATSYGYTQQKPLTPGEVAAKPTERGYPWPKCGRGKLLPYEIVRRCTVRLPALNAPTLASLTEGGGAEPAR